MTPEELIADVLAEIRLEPKSRNASSKMLFDGGGERPRRGQANLTHWQRDRLMTCDAEPK